MKRDNFGRKLRPSREEVKASADAAERRAKTLPASTTTPSPPPPAVSPPPPAAAPKKKGGRPATGRDPLISVRIPAEWLAIINAQPRGKRMEFIRGLMSEGITRHKFGGAR